MVTPGDPPISDPEHERAAEEAEAVEVEVEVEPQVDVMVRPPQPEPVYLGDGVYASFDGFHIWLAANDHRNQVIALEYSVMADLIRYARRVGMVE